MSLEPALYQDIPYMYTTMWKHTVSNILSLTYLNLAFIEQNPCYYYVRYAYHHILNIPTDILYIDIMRVNLLFIAFSGQYTSIPGSCNFETGDQDWTIACGLTRDSVSDFDWSIGNRAVTGQSGPDDDHTPGNIKFLTSVWGKGWKILTLSSENH